MVMSMPAINKTTKAELSPQQLAFCDNIVDGLDQTEAYRLAYPKCKSGHAQSASALLRNPKIRAEIQRLRAATESERTLSRQEKREFLASVVRAKVDELDGMSPLIQKKKVKTVTDKDGGTSESIELEMMSKSQAIVIDNQMMGDNEPERVEQTVTIVVQTDYDGD